MAGNKTVSVGRTTVEKLLAEKILMQKTMTARLFNILCAHPYGLYPAELRQVLFEHREDGGPLAARHYINVLACCFNKHAKDLRLGLRMRAPKQRYQLYVVRE